MLAGGCWRNKCGVDWELDGTQVKKFAGRAAAGCRASRWPKANDGPGRGSRAKPGSLSAESEISPFPRPRRPRHKKFFRTGNASTALRAGFDVIQLWRGLQAFLPEGFARRQTANLISLFPRGKAVAF